jgi:hypothetical protein
MKIRFFCVSQPEGRKNNLRISLITPVCVRTRTGRHDLGLAYTLPTPQNPLLEARWV